MKHGVLTWMFAALTLLLAVPAHAADTVYYYSSDTIHSEVVVTDQSRNVVERTYYAPYGQVLNRDLRDGPGYTGHEEDPETSLVYMQQRYYDPEAGRFLSTDPVQADGGGGSFNRYAYANDNPYRYTDPFGMCTGSHISNSDGTCASTGGYTTGTNGAAQGLNRALAAAKQVAIGVAKSIYNAWDSIRPGPSEGHEYASNQSQKIGMGAGGILIAAGVAAATDDPAVEGDEGALTEAFHYTASDFAGSIETNGLRAGTYATPNGALSARQAYLELSMSPEKGLPDLKVRINLAGLRAAGYEIPPVTRVSNVVQGASGRVYSMPGGGYEMRFPYSIPPDFITVQQ